MRNESFEAKWDSSTGEWLIEHVDPKWLAGAVIWDQLERCICVRTQRSIPNDDFAMFIEVANHAGHKLKQAHDLTHYVKEPYQNTTYTVCGLLVGPAGGGSIRFRDHPVSNMPTMCVEYRDADPAIQFMPPRCPMCHEAFYTVQDAWGHGSEAMPEPSVLKGKFLINSDLYYDWTRAK